MALCSLTVKRLDVPGEPGQWIELRPISPITMHRLDKAAKAAATDEKGELDGEEYGYELTGRLLEQCIVAWSYDAEVTPESVKDLDIAMTGWLAEELNKGQEVPLPTTLPSSAASAKKRAPSRRGAGSKASSAKSSETACPAS